MRYNSIVEPRIIEQIHSTVGVFIFNNYNINLNFFDFNDSADNGHGSILKRQKRPHDISENYHLATFSHQRLPIKIKPF